MYLYYRGREGKLMRWGTSCPAVREMGALQQSWASLPDRLKSARQSVLSKMQQYTQSASLFLSPLPFYYKF